MLQKQKDAAAAGCELWQVPPAVLRVSGCAGESCDWLIAHASRADLSDGGCHRVAVSMIWITTAVIGDQGTGAAAGGQAPAGHQQVAVSSAACRCCCVLCCLPRCCADVERTTDM